MRPKEPRISNIRRSSPDKQMVEMMGLIKNEVKFIKKKYPCSMNGCEEDTDSGLFKIDEKKSYIIPLCDKHFHQLVALRNNSDKNLLMIIDYKKLPRIKII